MEAVYENGVLVPDRPLDFSEHQRVRLAIETLPPDRVPLSTIHLSFGRIQWTGDAVTVRHIAEDDEHGILESK